jgi:integrase
MITAYRRHAEDCPHKDKGKAYSLCNCPISAYGTIKGLPFRHSLKTRDAAVAEARIRELEGGCAVLITLNAPKLAVAVEKYLEDCLKRKDPIRESTHRQYAVVLRRFAADPRGKLPITAITPAMVVAYGDLRKIKKGTWRNEIQTLNTFFDWTMATPRRWIDRSPLEGIKAPTAPLLPTKPYTEAEIDKLFNAAGAIEPEPRSINQDASDLRKIARATLATLLYSGLRISDVSVLRRDAITKSGHISIQIIKTDIPVKIKLHLRAHAALEALPLIADNPDYFFYHAGESRATCISRLRSMIKRLGEATGIHAHPHRFRDTFATALLDQGVDIRIVQKLLGHQSIKTTELHYAHHSKAQQDKLDAASTALDFESAAGRPIAVEALQDARRTA